MSFQRWRYDRSTDEWRELPEHEFSELEIAYLLIGLALIGVGLAAWLVL